MAATSKKVTQMKPKDIRTVKPALTPDSREQQMINLATKLAEKQLVDGTASPSIIGHYLKLATNREKMEREILESQSQLIKAKTESLKSSKDTKELYTQALSAMTDYSPAKD